MTELESEVSRLGYALKEVKIASNRAANSSQREAEVGKVRELKQFAMNKQLIV